MDVINEAKEAESIELILLRKKDPRILMCVVGKSKKKRYHSSQTHNFLMSWRSTGYSFVSH